MKAKIETLFSYDTSARLYHMTIYLYLSKKEGYPNSIFMNPGVKLMGKPLNKNWGEYFDHDCYSNKAVLSDVSVKKLLAIKKKIVREVTDTLIEVIQENKKLISLCPKDTEEILISDETEE